MRTTLDIADDVLAAANAVASELGKTLREVVSDLARQGPRVSTIDGFRNGLPLLKVQDPTPEMVNRLRDE